MATMMNMRIPTGASLFSAYASFCATFTLLQQAIYQFVPHAVRRYIYEHFKRWFTQPLPTQPDIFSFIIEETDGMNRNDIFEACQIYLCNKMNDSTNVLKVSRAPNEETMNFKLATGVKFKDTYQGIRLQWNFQRPTSTESSSSDDYPASVPPTPSYYRSNPHPSHLFKATEKSCFTLTFDKEHKKLVCNSYLPYVVETSQDIIREGKVLRLCDCTNSYGYGPSPSGSRSKHSVKMSHPFTFEKLAMDPEMKNLIMDDLDRFVKRKEFYRRVGKPWKRGYLLYGPPGTGKSSLIAAMANYLRFDIYDLQLGSVGYSSLRDLLLWIPSQSIIVVEDIDRTKGLPKRTRQMMKQSKRNDSLDEYDEEKDQQKELAPLLNFVDGLWSCCGDERLIVLTTNHKEKLDPALLRPGRMDMHIHMSYLKMPGFKTLAYNYLQVSDNQLFPEIESLLETVNATPAEVAEELMRSEDVDIALKGLVQMLNKKKSEPKHGPNVKTTVETEKQEDAEELKELMNGGEVVGSGLNGFPGLVNGKKVMAMDASDVFYR